MNDHDYELSKKLESIEAQLEQHARTTHLGMVWLTVLAIAALVLLGYHVVRL
jgi:hypothetical protein